jgi:hypothetical protein
MTKEEREAQAIEHMLWAHEEALEDQPQYEANPAKAVSNLFMRARQYVWEAMRGI